ncbi:MAG: GIY-YIG nuclease family protein [Xanthobacteraceae bacterium]
MSTDTYWVYILASRPNGTLYIGVTRDLRTRLEQHRSGRGSEFVKKYRVHQRPVPVALRSGRDGSRLSPG